MGDVGELFNALHKVKQEKRATNRENSLKILSDAGIECEVKNYGAHIIVRKSLDFWPGTGLWKDRKTKKEGRGVFRLLKHIGAKV